MKLRWLRPFGHHIYGAAGTFVGADATALAVVQVYLVFAILKLDYSIIGTYSKTVIATKAIAT